MNTRRASHLPAFQLTAYPPSSQHAVQAARSLIEASAAAVTDIRVYSNNLAVFQLSLRLGDWTAFIDGLLDSPIGLEAPASCPAPGQADQDGDVMGTLSVVMRGGAETRNLIPDVPG